MVINKKLSTTTVLNNGVEIPLLGLGVYDMYRDEAEAAVLIALETGYRLIDTAAMYANEKEIGNAIKRSSVPRKELFVTTKVNNTDQGYDSTLKAFERSCKLLQMDYVDLYLVHWPIKSKRKETWKALETLYSNKQVRCIGVANYLVPFLEELKSYSSVTPAVDQVEFSPYLFLEDLLNYTKEHKIQLQSYTPLIRGKRMNDPKLLGLAKKYNKTPSQIILRWNVQNGISAIPKSSDPARIKENFDVFDFEIEEADIRLMNGFHENLRVVDDPMVML